jgi:hypothetical protein
MQKSLETRWGAIRRRRELMRLGRLFKIREYLRRRVQRRYGYRRRHLGNTRKSRAKSEDFDSRLPFLQRRNCVHAEMPFS